MNNLKLTEILENFAYTLKNFEQLQLGSDVKFMKASESIDDQLSFFYETLIFEKFISVPGEVHISITSQERLEEAQLGWFLVRDKSNNWVEDHEHWDKDWIVFARRNADAIFYNKKDKSIRGKIVGSGPFFKLSNSLGEFIKILTDCLILEKEKYHYETTTDDEKTLPEFISDVKQILNINLDQELHADFLAFFFE